MNKIILWMQSSLDGYASGPNGEFDWPTVGPDLSAYFLEQLRGAGAFLYGRKVYEGMAAYWPTAESDPNSTSYHVEYAKLWKPMPKGVFSRSLTSADWNATVLSEIDQVQALREKADGDLYFFGGPEVARKLAEADLIDEYQIFIHPVVLGGGSPLFPAMPERQSVSLAGTRTFDDVVSLRYARNR